MKNITKSWVEFAEKDLYAAKDLLYGKSKRYDACIFFCHQTIEKILKSHLIEKRTDPKKIHDLVALLDATMIDLPKDMVVFIKKLSPHYMPTRYPDIAYKTKFHYDKRKAEGFYKNSKEVFLWIKKELMQKK